MRAAPNHPVGRAGEKVLPPYGNGMQHVANAVVDNTAIKCMNAALAIHKQIGAAKGAAWLASHPFILKSTITVVLKLCAAKAIKNIIAVPDRNMVTKVLNYQKCLMINHGFTDPA